MNVKPNPNNYDGNYYVVLCKETTYKIFMVEADSAEDAENRLSELGERGECDMYDADDVEREYIAQNNYGETESVLHDNYYCVAQFDKADYEDIVSD